MAMPRKPDPVILCAGCGVQLQRRVFPSGRTESHAMFAARRFCSRACANHAKVTSTPSRTTSHRRAARFLGMECARCGGSDQLHVHHLDLNPFNNERSNLMTLCNSCHATWHWENGAPGWKKRPACIVCGRPSHAHELCKKHVQRFMKHGSPYLFLKKVGWDTYALWDERLGRPAQVPLN
jgi:hypothetical protein